MRSNADTRDSQPLDRRTFVRSAAVLAAGSCLASCGKADESSEEAGPDGKASSTGVVTDTTVPRDVVLDLAESTAQARMFECHHCAQSTFLALEEVFQLDGGPITKALTPMPGIAERGETCGVVVASLLALGLVYGRDQLTDFEAWRRSLVPARAFCERFEGTLGSTACGDVVESVFGRRYDLYDPEDLQAFQARGATERCARVVGTGVRIAADLMLDAYRNET